MEPYANEAGIIDGLMNFVGCIGVLMKNGCLVLWLQHAFDGVPKF